jgi:hypothetical protein
VQTSKRQKEGRGKRASERTREQKVTRGNQGAATQGGKVDERDEEVDSQRREAREGAEGEQEGWVP